MMQVIDEAHIQSIMDLPDGAERMLRWVTQLLEERDDAKQQASAAGLGCFTATQKQLAAEARTRDLILANNKLIDERRWIDLEKASMGSMMLELQQDCINMRKALARCEAQYAFYSESHDAKGTDESARKAKVNRDMMTLCRDAIEGKPIPNEIVYPPA